MCCGCAHPGIPTWLGLKDGIEFRCTNDVWQSYMQQWFQTVVEQVTPYFAVNGGPIVVVQVWPPPHRAAGVRACEKCVGLDARVLALRRVDAPS